MKQYTRYKIIIVVLSLLVIFEAGLLTRLAPRKGKKVAPLRARPRIAIVLDDWGYNMNNLHFLDEIGLPLTISVLPNLNFSRSVAEEVNTSNVEVILHLPLEPFPSEKRRLEHDTIMTGMSEREIRGILLKNLQSLPHLRGVSNHMGSKATSDPYVMGVILKEMQKNKLYFLDSLVSGGSVCEKLSRDSKVKFAKRDIFLDNENNPGYIKGQINKLKLQAKRRGFAIGIGHDRATTLKTLKEVMPELEKEGYKFVFVSELVK